MTEILEYEILEKEFQEKISKSTSIKKYIIDALNLESDSYVFDKETEYINGITSDFTIMKDNQINAIIECKRADIGVTEYVRGIGQLFQYEYFKKNNILPKRFTTYKYHEKKYNNVLIIPSSFIKNTRINIGRFSYPESLVILEINLINDYVREINDKELDTLATVEKKNLAVLSQYYIRDNRLFELYMALLLLKKIGSINNSNALDRKQLEKDLMKTDSINNKNWRNVFISLSTLGFINNKNQLTESGLLLSNKNYEEFLVVMYDSYLKPYIDTLMEIFKESGRDQISINNQEIKNKIKEKFSGKDVLFLTESEGRYISSWMNILRDDYGCIEFEPRNSNRKVVYYPDEMNNKAFKNRVRKHTKGLLYVDNMITKMKNGEI